jgi:uncharacterized protein YkwD
VFGAVGLLIVLTALVVGRISSQGGSSSLDPTSSAAVVGMAARGTGGPTPSASVSGRAADPARPTRAAAPTKPATKPVATSSAAVTKAPATARSAPGTGAGTGAGTGGAATTTPFMAGVMLDPAAQVVALTNAERAKVGCPGLTVDARLAAAAQAHSLDMDVNSYFGHNTPSGLTPFQRMIADGYGFSVAAENIAAGQPTPSAVMAAWMQSPGHRANILNCALRQIGVGYAVGGTYGTYWTQDFGTP